MIGRLQMEGNEAMVEVPAKVSVPENYARIAKDKLESFVQRRGYVNEDLAAPSVRCSTGSL